MNNLLKKDGTKKLLASLLSIFIGLTVGALVVVIVGIIKGMPINGIWDGVRIIYMGILSTGRADGALTWGYNSTSWGNMLFRATPLIMTGLSVAIANKTGLFNIGAPGQYLMGTMASLMIALSIPAGTMPGFLVWLLAFLGGMLAGAAWGAIPGVLKAFLNINRYNPDYDFGAWICTIAKNTFVDFNRSRRSKALNPDNNLPLDSRYDSTQAPTPTPEESIINDQRRAQIDRYIAMLPEDYRRLFTLRFIDEYTYEEIADAMGITTAMVAMRLLRAKKKLKKMYDDEK